MVGEQLEVVFENGVFRPLRPIHLREHQHFTLVLPLSDESAKNEQQADGNGLDDEPFGYEPLRLQESRTIRVRVKQIGELPPVPYAIEPVDLEQE